eukprot:CAMPEP_0183397456 /NCGR_PEP_ID=MMETSP0370-20130417/10615_1 /TAXON_ID=268820 /ORGANISM="Peridinium aciculiferum, Strain PAER-2" /LENGTH=52 /DNA_ID=CAMNT_0025578345 /DNA_START=80 /DNA_END=235 /DNA_ORIENTATION=-
MPQTASDRCLASKVSPHDLATIGGRGVPPMPQTASKPLLTRSADVNIMGAHA